MAEFLGPRQVRWIAVSARVPSPYNPTAPIAREFVQTLARFRDELQKSHLP
jgi:hypothetical protein